MKKFSIVLLMVGAFGVQAAENLKFHGTLVVPPPCTISNDQVIEVNFNDVLIDTIDGNHFIQDVPYTLTCDASDTSDALTLTLTLTLTGTMTGYNDAAIETNVSGLGIELRQNNQRFKVGSTITFSRQSPPLLQAVPVKSSGAALQEGAFEAWATLQVDYQ